MSRHFGVFLVLGSFASLATGASPLYAWRAAKTKRVDEERARRTAIITVVAPAPLPAGSPLVGPEGNDADGYPARYVDRAAVRSLLVHHELDRLTRVFEELESAFEADPTREYWPHDAAEAFGSAEPELDPLLDAWIAARPDSFAPYIARAVHGLGVMNARRGGRFAQDTDRRDFDATEEAIPRVVVDARRALFLRPKLVTAIDTQLNAQNLLRGVSPDATVLLKEALTSCPTCFLVRASYMHGLEPRWGGSYDAMDAVAKAWTNPAAPRLRLFAGFADRDRADLLARDAKTRDAAYAAIERACAVGDYGGFLVQRAEIERDRGEFTKAIASLDRALVVRGRIPDLLVERTRVLLRQHQWEAAGRDYIEAIRMDPTHRQGRELFDPVVKGLVHEAWTTFEAGGRGRALDLLDLAADIAPANDDVQHRRQWIISGDKKAGDLPAIEAAAKALPDDFRAQQALDHALSKQKKLAAVVEMWTAFLARHPDEGRAYLERAGTYYGLIKTRESLADFSRACDLGVSEGCLRYGRLSASAKSKGLIGP